MPEGVFEGMSSYSNDYLNKELPARIEKLQQIKNQIIPQGRFQGDSTYTLNYLGPIS